MFVTVPAGLVEEVARRFALLSDPTRLRILDALLERDDITVSELANVVGEAAPNVSQHLSRLLAADIVGVNAGKAAGQTIQHTHLHVIPRYAGDVAEPRGGVRWVLPETARYW